MWRPWGGEVRERVMLVAFSEGGRKNSLPTLAFLPARAARSAGAWADRRRRGAHLALGDPQVHGFQGPADFSPF